MRRMRFAASLMLGLATATMPVIRAHAQVSSGLSIIIAPPELPVYEQPPIPQPDYLWVPGYWAYSDIGYYWVPGTWVLPPEPGLLWTPGYWGYGDSGYYAWHSGYWGPQVGYYGGVNYGYGYTGSGYQGGYWHQNHFFYNRTVNNFGGTHITNVYEHNVTNITVNRISYNGGNGGIDARPSQRELAYQNAHHYDPTPEQRQQEHLAAGNHSLWATQNHGVPPIAATPRPADFTAHGIVPAHNAPVNIPAPPQRGENTREPPHPGNAMTPQHPAQGAEAPRPENAMQMQRPENTMAPQHVTPPEQHAVQPFNPGAGRPPEPVQHTQPAPQAFHPQVQHEQAPAFHPQQVQPARPPEIQRPQGVPAFHPEQQHPQEQRPSGGGEHPPGPEHKPN